MISHQQQSNESLQQNVRTWLRNGLLSWGWDVRRTASYEVAKRAEWHQRELTKWRLLQTYAPRTILDIGANTGQFAQLARELLPTTRILSFEPLRECFEQLVRRSTELAPFEAYPYALGAADTTQTMNRNEFSPSSSLLPMDQLHKDELPFTAKTVSEEIQIRRLDGLVAQLGLVDPLFIKIDVQGYTEPVLRGGEQVIKRAQAVVAEVSLQPLYRGETTFDEAYALLTAWGFVYRGNVDQWCSERDGRILQCDCLFENANETVTGTERP